MRRLWGWGIAVVLVAASWFVALATPGDDTAQEPFLVPASMNEPAEGRTLTVTVTQARRADKLVAGAWRAEGSWLVVDLTASARGDNPREFLEYAILETPAASYRASERPTSFFEQRLMVDVPQRGGLAFELPEDAWTGTATLRVGADRDPRVDSVIALPLDLSSLPRDETVELVPVGWSEQ